MWHVATSRSVWSTILETGGSRMQWPGCARRSGQPKEAEECLRRGIDASDDPEGRSRLLWVLADVLIDEGKWADAKAAIETSGPAACPAGAGEVSQCTNQCRRVEMDRSLEQSSRRSIRFSSRRRPHWPIKPICCSERAMSSSATSTGATRPTGERSLSTPKGRRANLGSLRRWRPWAGSMRLSRRIGG